MNVFVFAPPTQDAHDTRIHMPVAAAAAAARFGAAASSFGGGGGSSSAAQIAPSLSPRWQIPSQSPAPAHPSGPTGRPPTASPSALASPSSSYFASASQVAEVQRTAIRLLQRELDAERAISANARKALGDAQSTEQRLARQLSEAAQAQVGGRVMNNVQFHTMTFHISIAICFKIHSISLSTFGCFLYFARAVDALRAARGRDATRARRIAARGRRRTPRHLPQGTVGDGSGARRTRAGAAVKGKGTNV
jgi:hypothetical protein